MGVGPRDDRHSLRGWDENHTCLKLTQRSSGTKRSEVTGGKGTYRSKLGVLGLVRVVVQTDEVKPRLHLIAAPTEHVIPADALAAHLITPVGRQEVEERRAGGKVVTRSSAGRLYQPG